MDDQLQPVLEESPSVGDEEKTALEETEELIHSQNGQALYRVVQVSGDEAESTVIAGLPPGTQVTQAVLHSPFAATASASDGSGDGAFTTYLPSGAVANSETGETVVSAQGGQFYVMMAPHDVLQNPRTTSGRMASATRLNRDDRRRTTHNEVERRRRDKINNWIVALSKLVPDCQVESVPISSNVSKSGILSKACEFIQDLKLTNARLHDSLKEMDRVHSENLQLVTQLTQAREEVAAYRRALEQHGVDPGPIADTVHLPDIE